MKKGGNEVAWKEICKSKDQGGLGLKDLFRWNDLFLIKHVWNLLSKKDTIWVDWVLQNRLKGRNSRADEQCRQASWMWNHLLDLRRDICNHMMIKQGDGTTASVWFDKWCDIGPLL